MISDHRSLDDNCALNVKPVYLIPYSSISLFTQTLQYPNTSTHQHLFILLPHLKTAPLGETHRVGTILGIQQSERMDPPEILLTGMKRVFL